MSRLIAGVDEVGRGPLAGPVVSAAVILPASYSLDGLTDSKKTSKKQRDQLAIQIKEQAIAWALGQASIDEIDKINILQASLLAMQRAVRKLEVKPTIVLVDGNQSPDFGIESKAIVGGDGSEPTISAASIIAKVYRDKMMANYGREYPGYGLETNMGYPTKQHREALQNLGVTAIHRRSFAPVKKILGES